MPVFTFLRQSAFSLCLGLSLQVVAQTASISERMLYAQPVEPNLRSTMELPGVLQVLESRYSIHFVYKGDKLKSKQVNRSSLENTSLSQTLEDLARQTGLRFEQTSPTVFTIVDSNNPDAANSTKNDDDDTSKIKSMEQTETKRWHHGDCSMTIDAWRWYHRYCDIANSGHKSIKTSY